MSLVFMENCLIANLAWNSSNWLWPTLGDGPSGFKYVEDFRHGIVADPPWESWNFNLDHLVVGGFKYGFFQYAKKPKITQPKALFFASKNPYDRKFYVVGVYGKAEIADYKLMNVRAPLDYVAGFCRPDILRLDPVRHLSAKKRIGRVGYNIIGKTEAINILDDAINAHQTRGCPKLSNVSRIINVLNNCLNFVREDC